MHLRHPRSIASDLNAHAPDLWQPPARVILPPMKQLADGALALGISLTDDQIESFQAYYETLIAWNTRMNLTQITGYQEVQVKHFLDSLSCVAALQDTGGQVDWGAGGEPRVLDLGTGAGFPGLPLKIAFPVVRLTLLEAIGKKTRFLQALVDQLGLTGVQVLNARAEEAGHDPAHRQAYDLVVARAVAKMPILAELALPLVRVGGLVIAQKGKDPSPEVESAHNAIEITGGRVGQILPVTVPGLPAARHLVVLEKASATPDQYPRRPGIPAKRPLQ